MSSLNNGNKSVSTSVEELVSKSTSTDFLQNILGSDLVEILIAQHSKFSLSLLRASIWTRFQSAWDLLNHPPARLAVLNQISIDDREVVFSALRTKSPWSSKESSDCLLDPKISWTGHSIRVLAGLFGCHPDELDEPPAASIQAESICDPAYGLRDYQLGVVSDLLDVLGSYTPRAMVHLPTGAGKTRVGVYALSRYLCQKPVSQRRLVLWIASRQELLEQASSELEKCWSSLGDSPLCVVRQWGGAKPDWDNIVASTNSTTVAFVSVQSMINLSKGPLFKDISNRTDLLVYDEAHEAMAPQTKDLFERMKLHLPDRFGWFGLSATPARSTMDEMDQLVSAFGATKITMRVGSGQSPIGYLTDQGYLSKPTYKNYSYEIQSDSDLEEANSIVQLPKLLEFLSQDAQRNLLILNLIDDAIQSGRTRILVFAPTVDGSNLLNAASMARGWQTRSIDGTTPPSRRGEALEWFAEKNESPRVLFNCQLLTAGFDNPIIDACFITRPTNSAVEYSQMVGRALRGPASGGTRTCLIASISDDSVDKLSDVSLLFNSWEDYWNG